jgi:hypothetical protein
MTREEPSLETWLQNIKTMDKVQRIDRSNTAPSSKTFRDESVWIFCLFLWLSLPALLLLPLYGYVCFEIYCFFFLFFIESRKQVCCLTECAGSCTGSIPYIVDFRGFAFWQKETFVFSGADQSPASVVLKWLVRTFCGRWVAVKYRIFVVLSNVCITM